jgi:hypothetical protein
MTKKILSFPKLNFIMVPQNHRTSLYILKKDFTTRPKLVHNKLVLKVVHLKWVYLLTTFFIGFRNVKFHVFFKINIVPKFLNTYLNFKGYKIMFWLILTSIVLTQQVLHTRVWISLHITRKLLLSHDNIPNLKTGSSPFNRYTNSQYRLHIRRKSLDLLTLTCSSSSEH